MRLSDWAAVAALLAYTTLLLYVVALGSRPSCQCQPPPPAKKGKP